jgi:hypothetical protein
MKTPSLARYALVFLSLVLTATALAAPAVAQTVDTKGEQELTTVGQKIDKTAAGADGGRVTARLVDEWKGTKFQFEAGSQPRALTAQDVQDLRAKGLGFGEISTLLALTAKQGSANPKSVDEILAMRQGHEGWGKIARDLGFKNLGSVISKVKATDKGITHVASSPHVDKVSGVDKPEKLSKIDKPERIERVERPERPERPGR